MCRVTIPADQHASKGQLIKIILDNTIEIYIVSKTSTRTASYNEYFYTEMFDQNIHGFSGINHILKSLCRLLK